MFRRLLTPTLPLLIAALFATASTGRAHRVAAQDSRVTIVGSVVDASGSPLSGVLVTLEREQRMQGQTLTDRAGMFRFSGIAPGAYRVRAEYQGLPALARDLVVPAGVTTLRLPLVLAAAINDASKTADRDERAGMPPLPGPAVPGTQATPAAGGEAASGEITRRAQWPAGRSRCSGTERRTFV